MSVLNSPDVRIKPRPVAEMGTDIDHRPYTPCPIVELDPQIWDRPYELEVDQRAIGSFLIDNGLSEDEIWQLKIQFTKPSSFSALAGGRYNPITHTVSIYPGGFEQKYWSIVTNIEQVVTGETPSSSNLEGINAFKAKLERSNQNMREMEELNKRIREANKKTYESLKADKNVAEIVARIEEDNQSQKWKPRGQLDSFEFSRGFLRTQRLPAYILNPNIPAERKVQFAKKLITDATSRDLSNVLTHELGHVLQFKGGDRSVAIFGLSQHITGCVAITTGAFLSLHYLSNLPDSLEKTLLMLCLTPAMLVAGGGNYYLNLMEADARKFAKEKSPSDRTSQFVTFKPK